MDVVQVMSGGRCLARRPAEIMAVAVWGQVHGIISLILEGQVSHVVLDRFSVREIVFFALDQTILGKSPS